MSAGVSKPDLDAELVFGLTLAELLSMLLVLLLFGLAALLQYTARDAGRLKAAPTSFGTVGGDGTQARDGALVPQGKLPASPNGSAERANALPPLSAPAAGPTQLAPGQAGPSQPLPSSQALPSDGAPPQSGSSKGGARPDPGGDQFRMAGLEAALREARRDNQALQADLQALRSTGPDLAGLKAVVEGAAKVNPGAPPPAVLQDGLRALEALGPTNDPVRAIQQLKADSQARRENEPLQASLQSLRMSAPEVGRLKEVVEGAAKVNPAAPPPAVLQEGLRALEALGPTNDPVRTIQQLKADSEGRRAAQGELQDYQRLIEAAMKLDPNAPPTVTLQRALAGFAQNEDTTSSIRSSAGRISRNDRDGARASEGAEDSDTSAGESSKGSRYSSAQPCWISPSGETEYLFEITIRDNYLTLRDLAPASRAQDTGYRLSRPLLRKGKFEAEEFRRLTAPIFRSSVSQGCRYLVQMRDSTGADSKDAYKTWRSLIASHFFVKPVS